MLRSPANAAETAECACAADISLIDCCTSEFQISSRINGELSISRSSASTANSSLCSKSIALSTPSGSQYSAHAHKVFPSGDTSKPPSLYSNALGTNVLGFKESKA
jgi:hypothetical protein